MMMRKISLGCLCALTMFFVPQLEASARLGQSIEGFKGKLTSSFKFKGQTKKQDRTYYMFSLVSTASTQNRAPGFGAGITATVVDGKVVGQSMVLRLGDNFSGGKELATLHSMDFAYEALGKSPPSSQASLKQELDQYSSAIDQVLGGSAQHVRYPGFTSLITMSRTTDGDVLIAITPEFGQTSNAKPTKQH